MSALARRVLAAVVLMPLVVAAVLWLPTWGFAMFFGVFAMLGAWEWPAIASLGGAWRVLFWLGTVALLGILTLTWPHPGLWGAALLVSMLFWAVALIWVIQSQHGGTPSGLRWPLLRVLAGWSVLVPCWSASVMLHARDPSLVLLVLVLIWVADSAAFFAGRRFGRRRLASRVSPGKSWEGVLAGIASVAVAVWGLQFSGLIWVNAPTGLVVLCVVVAALSVLGDLNESLFKRRAGVKDSGTLIPGHGGVLDRIDSLTAAAPAFTVGWLTLGLELS